MPDIQTAGVQEVCVDIATPPQYFFLYYHFLFGLLYMEKRTNTQTVGMVIL